MNPSASTPSPSQPAAPAGAAPAAPAPGGAPTGGTPPAGSQTAPAAGTQNPTGLAPVGQHQEGQGSLPGVSDAGGKPEGNAPSAPAVELKLPEGTPPELASLLKGAGSDPQKLVDAFFAHRKAEAESFDAKWAELEKSWVKQLTADPLYGRDVKASDEAVNRGLEKHDPAGRFTSLLQKQGLALHPDVRLFLRSVGLAIPGNDSVAGRVGVAGPVGPKSEDQILEETFDHPTSRALAARARGAR